MEWLLGLRIRGATTFLTMAYILAVNPQLLAQAGRHKARRRLARHLLVRGDRLGADGLGRRPADRPGTGDGAERLLRLRRGARRRRALAGGLGAVFLSGLPFLAELLLRVQDGR